VAPGLARGRRNRRDTAQVRERGLTAEAVDVCPAAINIRAPLMIRMPNSANVLGATRASGLLSCASRASISSPSAWMRRAMPRNAMRAALLTLEQLDGYVAEAVRRGWPEPLARQMVAAQFLAQLVESKR
jgi:hypothetical protein